MFKYQPRKKVSTYTAIALLAGIFVLDLLTPLGVAVGLLYILVVMLLVRHDSPTIVGAAGLSIALTLGPYATTYGRY